jgi:hypothetical protein
VFAALPQRKRYFLHGKYATPKYLPQWPAPYEKVMISDALTLLTNAVIAYNTWKLHQVLERSRETGQSVPRDEILAHIAPIAFRHINFQGIYRFPLERYLDRLLPSVLPRKIAGGAK